MSIQLLAPGWAQSKRTVVVLVKVLVPGRPAPSVRSSSMAY